MMTCRVLASRTIGILSSSRSTNAKNHIMGCGSRFSSSFQVPNVKSNQSCMGCGSNLQTGIPELKGFIPPEVQKNFSDGWLKRWTRVRGSIVGGIPGGVDSSPSCSLRRKSTRIYCQRCYRLQQYGRIDDPVQSYHEITDKAHVAVDDIVCFIPRGSVVLHIIDVLNLESSALPELYEKLPRNDIPVLSVVNKVDCLPSSDDSSAKSILKWAGQLVKVLRRNVGPDGKLNLVAVSSASGVGFNDLEVLLSKYISSHQPRNIYVVGSVNSGKSTFCNRFLKHIGFRHLGHIKHRRGIGGITRSPIPGTTKRPISFSLDDQMCLVDTPGVSLEGTMLQHMSTSDDFRTLCSNKRMQPTISTLKEGTTLLIGAMARVSLQSGISAQIAPFVSPKATIHICKSSNSEELLRRKAGTFLYPPFVHDQLQSCSIITQEWVKHRIRVFCSPSRSYDDVVIAGLGWISVYGHGHKVLEVIVPKGVNVFRRPSILPTFIRIHGASVFNFRSRGRSLRISKHKKRLTRLSKDGGSKHLWRAETQDAEQNLRQKCVDFRDTKFISPDTADSYVVI